MRLRVANYLNRGPGGPPSEWTDYRLCQLYSCVPSDLDEQEYARMNDHLICQEMETRKRNLHDALSGHRVPRKV